jgi:hypothetical protein
MPNLLIRFELLSKGAALPLGSFSEATRHYLRCPDDRWNAPCIRSQLQIIRTDVAALVRPDNHTSSVRYRRPKMKSVLFATAITLIGTGSAIAASQLNSRSERSHLNSRAMVGVPDSSDVYVNGKLIGRDPDPSVRFQLRSGYYSGGGN